MAQILLVDDDPHTLDVLDFALGLEGHTTTRAVHGAAGVELARETCPDLIVLDSMMPVMDGITATELLRRDPRTEHTPIIMLTARVGDADAWRAYRAGVATYVTKPIDLDVIHLEVNRMLTAVATRASARPAAVQPEGAR